MNLKKDYPLITLFLTLTITAWSQPKALPDSIRIEFADHKAIVSFELRDYAQEKEIIKNFSSILNPLLENLRKSIPQQELSDPHTVTVVVPRDPKPAFLSAKELSTQQEIRIQRETAVTTITTKDNAITELLPPGWKVSIKANRYHISIYAPDFETLITLTKLDFQPAMKTLDADSYTNQSRRKGFDARIVMQRETVAFSKIDHRYPHDLLGLHVGAGVGVFRERIYPELHFTAAFYFSNRFRAFNQRVDFTYELKYFSGRTTEGNYQSLPNSFLSVSYSRNFAKERPRWTGIGVGYLIQSRGDLYTGKTMKFFFNSDIGSSKLNLVPEFYLTNDFKKFTFGLKLKYDF
jgi:hypothetical protein